jgi:hypothetical protein
MKTSYLSKRMSCFAEIEMSTNYINDNKLKIEIINKGIVHPLSKFNENKIEQFGGVTNENFTFIDISSTYRNSPPNFNQAYNKWYSGPNPSINKNEIIYHDHDVVYIGALHAHWGHFITEGVSRLWYFLNEKKLDISVAYIADDGADRFIDIFKLFGINPNNLIKIDKPTKFRNVIVPEQSIRLQDKYHQCFNDTIERIIENSVETESGKIFLSKRKRWNGRAIGEIFFENIFKSNGYKIIYPEEISIRDFISLMKGCNKLVSVTGSSAHSGIFLKNEVKVVYLNRSSHFHPIQTMIDQMKSLNATYIDTYMNFLPHEWSSGPFLLWPTKYFIKFCDDSNIRINNFELVKTYIISLTVYIVYYLYQPLRYYIYAPLRKIIRNY